jgi:uncharacterized protein (DUF3820 family)
MEDPWHIPMLSDLDPMPNGKHEGRTMAEVPAKYLLSIRKAGWIQKYPELVNYIKKYESALRLEVKATNTEQGERHGHHSNT